MKIAPSILDANWGNLQADINSISTADRIHLDIMDGHFVPNFSVGANILKKVDFNNVEIEAHLMVNNPESFFGDFIELGVMGITFHIENTGRDKALELLQDLKAADLKAGISIDGYTSQEFLSDEILKIADQILIMSIKAGFGGQKLMDITYEKIKALRARGYKGEIMIDGGVNIDNVTALKEAGADIVVVGSFLMKKSPGERKNTIKEFQTV